MGCGKPTLKENLDKGMERQEKILKLVNEWYKEATETTPPPVDDPSVLSYNTLCRYYYTEDTQDKSNIETLVSSGLNEAVAGLTGVTINTADIINIVAAAMANTTKNETGQGYGTCVLKSYEGTYNNKDCLYKPLVVVVSFNFSASEYNTSQNVAAYAYWVYLLCTERPLSDDSAALVGEDGLLQLKSVHGEKLKYKVPKDTDIVGKKYMTVKKLDDHR